MTRSTSGPAQQATTTWHGGAFCVLATAYSYRNQHSVSALFVAFAHFRRKPCEAGERQTRLLAAMAHSLWELSRRARPSSAVCLTAPFTPGPCLFSCEGIWLLGRYISLRGPRRVPPSSVVQPFCITQAPQCSLPRTHNRYSLDARHRLSSFFSRHFVSKLAKPQTWAKSDVLRVSSRLCYLPLHR